MEGRHIMIPNSSCSGICDNDTHDHYAETYVFEAILLTQETDADAARLFLLQSHARLM